MGADSSKKLQDSLSLERIRGALNIEKSLLLLFRFRSIDEEEWQELLQRLHIDSPNFSFLQVRTAVTRETVAEEFDLSRNSETPMFTSTSFASSAVMRHDEEDESSASEVKGTQRSPRNLIAHLSEQDKGILKQAKKQLREEARSFFQERINNEKGKQRFVSWMWRLITKPQRKEADIGSEACIVGVKELRELVQLVRRDRIKFEDLIFKPVEDDEECELVTCQLLKEFDFKKQNFITESDFALLGSYVVLLLKVRCEEAEKVNKVSSYTLKYTLGKGSFGVVRYAVEKKTGKAYAIKIIKTGDVNDMTRIDTEIKAMMMLQHENVVRLEKVLNSPEHVFFISELCGGGTLYEYTEGAALSEPQIRFFFKQLVTAVQYCHSVGVAHRDLKLDNLLLDNEGNLKVTDFGHAGIFQRGWDIFQTQLVGGLCHIAPEQLNGTPYSGEKMDIWGLGVIFYVLLFAKAPFRGNQNEMFQKILAADYKIPGGYNKVTQKAEDLLKLMLIVDPSKRASCKKIMKHPWMSDIEEKPVMDTFEIQIVTNSELFCGSTMEVYSSICSCLSNIGVFTLFKNRQTSPQKRVPPVKCHFPEKEVKFTLSWDPDDEEFTFFLFRGDCGPFRNVKRLILKEIQREEKRLRNIKKKRTQTLPDSPPVKQQPVQTPALRKSDLLAAPKITDSKGDKKKKEKEKSTIKSMEEQILGGDITEHLEIFTDGEKLEDFLKTQIDLLDTNATLVTINFEKKFSKTTKHFMVPNIMVIENNTSGKKEENYKGPISTSDKVSVIGYFGIDFESEERSISKQMKNIYEFKEKYREPQYGETIGTLTQPQIHIIWYFIDASKNFTQDQEDFCKKLLDVQVFFVLNKLESVPKKKIEKLKNRLKDLALADNDKPPLVFELQNRPVLDNIVCCPECGSDDIVIKFKNGVLKCKSCTKIENLPLYNGQDDLITKTTEVFPSEQRTAFDETQSTEFLNKKRKSRKIIKNLWKNFPRVYTNSKLQKIISEALYDLCEVWEFSTVDVGNFTDNLAREYSKRIERSNVAFHKKRQVQRVQVVGLGILFNDCLKCCCVNLYRHWTPQPSMYHLTKKIFSTSLEPFTDKNCLEIFKKIIQCDIRLVLQDILLDPPPLFTEPSKDEEDTEIDFPKKSKDLSSNSVKEKKDKEKEKEKEKDKDKRDGDYPDEITQKQSKDNIEKPRKMTNKLETPQKLEEYLKKSTRKIEKDEDYILNAPDTMKKSKRSENDEDYLLKANDSKKNSKKYFETDNDDERREESQNQKQRERWEKERWEKEKEKGERDEYEKKVNNDSIRTRSVLKDSNPDESEEIEQNDKTSKKKEKKIDEC